MLPFGLLPLQIHQDTTASEVVIDLYTDFLIFLTQVFVITLLVSMVWGGTICIESMHKWWKRGGIRGQRKAWNRRMKGCLKDGSQGVGKAGNKVRFAEEVWVKRIGFVEEDTSEEGEPEMWVEELKVMNAGTEESLLRSGKGDVDEKSLDMRLGGKV